ncbi:MAG TPA: hypothetical protein VGS19_09485 [Streptosporangiaceae bacterium]|nr:hypothetical protein [Streptosporangiaceae bacterium]
MRGLWRRVAGLVCCSLVTLGVVWPSCLVPAEAAQAGARSCSGAGVQPSPSPGSFDGLTGIAVLGTGNAWAVGHYFGAGGRVRTMIEHWDGRRWRQVASRNPAADDSLTAVAAVSPADVWAVGSMSSGAPFSDRPLVEHWDGSAWRVVPAPGAGTLIGLATAAADDVWAVGSTVDGNKPVRTLAERWDGTRWRVVGSPNTGPYGNRLVAVSAASPSSVWAVGTADTKAGTGSLAEHWDGTRWSVVPIPQIGLDDTLNAIASAGARDVWAVGAYDQQTPVGTVTYALTWHWDGTRWSAYPSPGPTGDDVLEGVTAVSASDIWAVGTTAGDPARVQRWNGHQWILQRSPYVHGALNLAAAVAASPATGVWIVGGYIALSNYSYHTLTEHLCPPA